MDNPIEKLNTQKYDKINQELTVRKIITDKVWDSHWHDFLEIGLIVSGKGKIRINNQECIFKAGCIYITTPSTLHMFVPDGKVTLYNVTLKESYIFNESIIQNLLSLNEVFLNFECEEFQKLLHIFELLEYENNLDFEYKSIILNRLLECMLLYLMRHTDVQFEINSISVNSILSAQSYIKMNFQKKISIKKIASMLGYSTGYFSTLFRKVVGITFIEYLSNTRLEYAEKLLSLKKYSVNEICKMSGFSSYSNFLKAFKKKYGTIPTNHIQK